MNKYPCTACANRERCTGRNYQCCQKWCEQQIETMEQFNEIVSA